MGSIDIKPISKYDGVGSLTHVNRIHGELRQVGNEATVAFGMMCRWVGLPLKVQNPPFSLPKSINFITFKERIY